MRGIRSTVSRLSAARAVFAGAAILAGTALRPAQATASGAASPEETAMAVPRVLPPAGSSGVGLPQPDACAIYALLMRRLPAGARPPPAPASASLSSGFAAGGIGAPSAAASAARDALVRGRDAAALRVGRAAFAQSRGRDGEAAYVAGLAAWRRGAAAASASLFEGASLAEGAGAALRASAAFWASRAHLRSGDSDAAHRWLLRAAAEPRTLHGMLARHQLGLAPAAAFATPMLGQADMDAIAATPQGRRAFALLQVGEPARAEGELRGLWSTVEGHPALSRALFLVAGAAQFPALVADLSGVVGVINADLPAPPLRPRGGFRLDRALVYAVTHVESNFDSAALSGAGANGLMQLMPQTASALGHAVSADALRDSGQNLRLGQAYLAYLAQPGIAGDDLLRVLASYNAGPNAVQRWAAQLPAECDPLMFLETIQAEETRHFVQRTLTNLWGYAARFRLASPSLEALADGVWPRFTPELGAVPRPRIQQAVVRLH